MTTPSKRSPSDESKVLDTVDTTAAGSRKRSATKNVNYNEKEADNALARKIKQLEKFKVVKSKADKNNNSKKNGLNKKIINGKANFKYQSFLQDKNLSWNFIPSLPTSFRKYARFSTLLDIDGMTVDVSKQTLISEGNTVLKLNNHIYMVSEPPGEPYYIGRIVEFVPKKEYRELISNSLHVIGVFPAVYFQLRMNWFYRPRDIQDRTNGSSSRLLYASLHNDLCPIYSFRGKCNVKFQKEFASNEELIEYVSKPNNFYFNQLFDRFTLKYYQMEQTAKLRQDVDPESHYLKVLAQLYPYVFYEDKYPLHEVIKKYICGHKMDDQSWDNSCMECRDWCHSASSIHCDECKFSIHLWCMDPPLEKKPAKGIVWICSACVAKQENSEPTSSNIPQELGKLACLPVGDDVLQIDKTTTNKENWNYQYLGEDMCNHLIEPLFDDYIAPFPWKRSRVSTNKGQWTKCNQNWIPEPYSNIEGERGSDKGIERLWTMNVNKISEKELDAYINKCQSSIPKRLDVQPESCNFIDICLKLLMDNDYNPTSAYEAAIENITRDSLREPTLSPEEIKKFEEGISLYGSELHPVCKHVGTQPMSMIVRYYYYWKKTPNGRAIWGNFKGRSKNKKKNVSEGGNTNQEHNLDKSDREFKRVTKNKSPKHSDKVWRHIDDSSFDSDKISDVKKEFQCMFCSLDYSPLWYRVTGGSDDDHVQQRIILGMKTPDEDMSASLPEVKRKGKKENDAKLNALCIRCARIWRRYGVRWRTPIEVLKQLYGSSASSIQTAVSELIEENDNQLKSYPNQQAFSKCLDWELVVDAESITKQRYSASDNPEKLLKMKRNALSSQSQLNKATKKLIDVEGIKPNNMENNLHTYINNIEMQIKKKEEKRLKKLKERELQEKLLLEAYSTNKNKGVKKEIKKEPKTEDIPIEPVVNKVGKLHPEIKPQTSNEQKKVPPMLYNNSALIKKLLPSGEYLLNMESNLGKADSLSTVTVDPEFLEIKLSDTIINQLKRERESIEIMRSMPISPKQKIAKTNNSSINQSLSTTSKNHIPILKADEMSRSTILQMYNNISPKYGSLMKSCKREEKKSSKPKAAFQTTKGVVDSDDKAMTIGTLIPREGSPGDKVKDKCSVCFGICDSEFINSISCLNCKVKVHFQCYGVTTNSKRNINSKEKSWLCDPCSNDRNPIFSTNYQCSLCSGQKKTLESADKSSPGLFPEAFKRTMDGKWCHILCAIYCSDAKFASGETLQPILNVESVLFKQSTSNCELCKESCGVIVKCECCDDCFHISCCANIEGFKLGFKKELNSDCSRENFMTFYDGALEYIVFPTLTCTKHQNNPEILPLNYTPYGQSVSLFELFLKTAKIDPQAENLSTIQLRTHDKSCLRMRDKSMNQLNMGTKQCLKKTFNEKAALREQLLTILKAGFEKYPCPEIEKEEALELPKPPERKRAFALISSIATGYASESSSKPSRKTKTKKGVKTEWKNVATAENNVTQPVEIYYNNSGSNDNSIIAKDNSIDN